MLKVGLTGGIGSGKSTVSALFAEMGVPIVDADLIARQLVEPGQPALHQLRSAFGDEILNQDGSLNRSKLREFAFSNVIHKQQLDDIMHPLIYKQMELQVSDVSSVYCILAIPLLLESAKKYAVDRVLVVDCPEQTQLQRVLERDNVSQEQALAIMAAQADRQHRLAAADDIIHNDGSVAHLAEQVKNLHNSYLLLATARTTSA